MEKNSLPTNNEESYKDLGLATARNGAMYVSSKIISSVVILVILIFLARYLKSDYYGLYTIVVAFSTLLGAGGNFGISTTFRKKLSENNISNEEKSNVISSGLTLSLSISFILAVIGILISKYMAFTVYHEPLLVIPFVIASITIFFTVLYNVTSAVLFGINKVKEASKITIIYSISQALAVLTLVLLGYSIIGALSGIVISLIIGSLISIYYLRKFLVYKFKFQPLKKLKEMFFFSSPILVSNLVYLGLTSFAIAFLALFVSPSIVGTYGVAFRSGRIIEVITASLTFVLLPTFSNVITDKLKKGNINKIFNNSIYYSFLILAPITVYLISVSKPLMYLLFSESYTYSYIYFSLILIGLLINIIGMYSGQLMVGYGKTKLFMKYQILTLIIELSLLLILTPILKVYGVLLSLFLIGPIIFSLIYILVLYKNFKIKFYWKRLFGIISASALLFVVLYLVSIILKQSKIAILLNLILTFIIFVPLASAFKGIDKSSLEFIKSIKDRYKKSRTIINIISTYIALFVK